MLWLPMASGIMAMAVVETGGMPGSTELQWHIVKSFRRHLQRWHHLFHLGRVVFVVLGGRGLVVVCLGLALIASSLRGCLLKAGRYLPWRSLTVSPSALKASSIRLSLFSSTRCFFSSRASSDMIHSFFMPTSKHFVSRHRWQNRLETTLISHCSLNGQRISFS